MNNSQPKRKTLTFQIEPDLEKKVKQRAKAEHLKSSDIVRLALWRFLEAPRTSRPSPA